jgi:hypothetical protein
MTFLRLATKEERKKKHGKRRRWKYIKKIDRNKAWKKQTNKSTK